MAAPILIRFPKGADVIVPFLVALGQERPSWLTAASRLRLSVRDNEGSATALLSKTTGAGLTVTLLATADFQVEFDSADTQTLAAGQSYYCAVERIDPGSRQLLADGPFILDPPEYLA